MRLILKEAFKNISKTCSYLGSMICPSNTYLYRLRQIIIFLTIRLLSNLPIILIMVELMLEIFISAHIMQHKFMKYTTTGLFSNNYCSSTLEES